MVRRVTSTFLFFVAAYSIAVAPSVSALGLGELDLETALNQPLQAKIQLLNVNDLAPEQILVKLASPRDFALSGVEREFFLTNLIFAVHLDGIGNGYVDITTKKAVTEPYLDFVVEARWPAGKLLREYTILLDLPIYTEKRQSVVSLATAKKKELDKIVVPTEKPQQVKEVSAADSRSEPLPVTQSTSEPEPEPEPEPVPATKAKADTRKPQPKAKKPTTAYEGETYEVKKNDRMWAIANRLKPSDRVSVQQTMVTIQRINPEAFIDNNINLIRTGQVLRVPTEQEVLEISARQAIAVVAEQNLAWRKGAGVAPLEATRPATKVSHPATVETDGRLRLSAVDTNKDSQIDGKGESEAAALRSKLIASKEDIEKLNRENQDIRDLVDEMDSQITTLKRMVELKDNQLSSMQQNMAKAADQAALEKQSIEKAEAEKTVAEKAVEGSDVESKLVDKPVVVESEKKPTVKQSVEQPKPKSKPQMSMIDSLLAKPLYLIMGLVVLVGLVVAIVMRRRGGQEEEYTQEESEELYVESEIEDQTETVEPEEIETDLDDFEEAGEAETEQGELEETELETGDAIGEADIYVAYGRYQHAIELLQVAISREPERSELRVKLLEVYIEAEDREAFKAQYVELQAQGKQSAIDEVKELLASVDGVSDWLDGIAVGDDSNDDDDDDDESEGAISADDFDVGDEVELGLDLTEDTFDTELNEAEFEAAELEEAEFDFESDSSLDLGSTELESESLSTDLGEDLSLDSDLDEVANLDEVADPDDVADLGGVDDFGEVLEDETDDELDLNLGADFEQHVGGEEAESESLEITDEEPSAAVTEDAQEILATFDEDDEDFEFVSDADEIATKLDLARAYVDMGDIDGAKDILQEVVQEGDEGQQAEANELLSRIT